MIAGLTIGSVLLGIALLFIVILYLARPFILPEDEAVRLDREEVDGLVLRRDTLLRQIRDLDDDMEAAKVAPEMYQRNRPQLVRQAAAIMQQLDAHGYSDTPAPIAADLDAQMEAAVRRLRTPEQVDADIEAAVRATRVAASAPVVAAGSPATPAASFCPKCGRRVEADDRFCPKCGYAFVQEPAKARA